MFISILRWLGFNLEFNTIDPEPVKVVPTQVVRVEPVKLIGMKPAKVEEDAGTTHPAALIDVEREEIFNLGKPITCLMITCKRCDKIDPIQGCIAYDDPSLLLWHKLGQWCPLNSVPQPTVTIKKRKTNPLLKASKREARARAAAKAAA